MDDNYIVYWTDDHNPPRRLVVPPFGITGEFPFPDIRDSFLAEDPDFDIAEQDIYRFRSQYGYYQGAGMPLFNQSTLAGFGSLPAGIKIGFHVQNVLYEKRGLRAQASYSVQTGVPGYDATQGQNFDYNLCAGPGSAADGILSASFDGFGFHVIDSFSTGVTVSTSRSGGFLFYFPCRWWGPYSVTLRRVTVLGLAILPRGQAFVNGAGVPITISKVWPNE
jgi:hypothetical protein